MGSDHDHSRPIQGVDELVEHFALGAKPASDARIGMEHEKIGVLADGRAPDYDVIGRLLEQMAERGWSRIEESGRLIALTRPTCGNITLELQNLGPAPFVLEAGRRIAQLIFIAMESEPEVAYGEPGSSSHYQGQRGTTPARG